MPANPFTDVAIASRYDAWYATEGRRADRLEKRLLGQMLARFPGTRTVLEVGCGTGHFTRWLEGMDVRAVGLEAASAMLAEAVRLGSRLCVQGDALALPFPADSFDLVVMITALEFISDPLQALTEGWRVARNGLVLGVLNRDSRLGRQLMRAGGPIWGAARLLTPAELVEMAHQAVADERAQVVWRTTLWPLWPGALPLPWGGFIGMAIKRT
ncbi:MAG: class I SAM-dependent methyltransferase [Anaerolineae bacterium]|nr:class I SAM-dependent methyltransferase [Anaerolineae bacterium]